MEIDPAVKSIFKFKYDDFKLVGLARNFGHQLAITAGVDYATGNAIVVMDADLQDPPEVVRDMLADEDAWVSH